MIWAQSYVMLKLDYKGRVAAAAITITTHDLEQIWISQDGRCYYSGIEISYTTKDWLTSLERLDQGKGYTRDNVALCCLEFNSCSQWSADKIVELINLCDAVHQDEISSDFLVCGQKRAERMAVVQKLLTA
eukprot:jgi/Chrzof1/13481/UNPLg00567.t1